VFCCKILKTYVFVGERNIPLQASLAERVNRNLKLALKIFHYQTQTVCDEDLSWLSMAFITAVHESTQATPDTLFWGREMRCPFGVRWDLSPVNYWQVNGKGRCFWSQAYRNLKLASRKMCRGIIRTANLIGSVLGTLSGIA
jgi:hypothetical protein